MKLTDDTTELTISATAADAEEFTRWCEDQGLTRDQGFTRLLVLTRRDRNVDLLFDDDKFAKAFSAARGKIAPDTVLE